MWEEKLCSVILHKQTSQFHLNAPCMCELTLHLDLVYLVPVSSSWVPCADAKRLIGRRFDDSVVQSDMKHWPFKVINDASRPKVQVEYKGEIKSFFPEEISSMVLVKMKEIAEAYLGKVRMNYSLLLLLLWL